MSIYFLKFLKTSILEDVWSNFLSCENHPLELPDYFDQNEILIAYNNRLRTVCVFVCVRAWVKIDLIA